MPTEEQTYRAGVVDSLDRIETKIDIVDTKASYTNGKVKKIIIALVLIGGILIGQTMTGTVDLPKLILHLIGV